MTCATATLFSGLLLKATDYDTDNSIIGEALMGWFLIILQIGVMVTTLYAMIFMKIVPQARLFVARMDAIRKVMASSKAGDYEDVVAMEILRQQQAKYGIRFTVEEDEEMRYLEKILMDLQHSRVSQPKVASVSSSKEKLKKIQRADQDSDFERKWMSVVGDKNSEEKNTVTFAVQNNLQNLSLKARADIEGRRSMETVAPPPVPQRQLRNGMLLAPTHRPPPMELTFQGMATGPPPTGTNSQDGGRMCE
jgi:hypothetical protein